MKKARANTVAYMIFASLLLAGCAAGVSVPANGSHLTDAECRDLTALRSNATPTMAQHHSELAALQKSGL
jgi:hypothetical protein